MASHDARPLFPQRLGGRRVAIFCDFQFEDMEVMFPKLRLEEEGAEVMIVGAHPVGTVYKGKHGYPVKCTHSADTFVVGHVDALVLPGGFAPDYMRRCPAMLAAISVALGAGKPCAAICHGPWMFCSARFLNGDPVVKGRRCTAFAAIKDDVVNAGATWVDEAVVVDGPLISSRTPADLVPFVHAIIRAVLHSQPRLPRSPSPARCSPSR